MMGHKNTCQAT